MDCILFSELGDATDFVCRLQEPDFVNEEYVTRLLGFVSIPKNREIVIRRFGLDGRTPETRKAIARRYGRSISVIQQRELSAIRELRQGAWWLGVEVC